MRSSAARPQAPHCCSAPAHLLQARRAREHARRVVDVQQARHARAPACQPRGRGRRRAADDRRDGEAAPHVLQRSSSRSTTSPWGTVCLWFL